MQYIYFARAVRADFLDKIAAKLEENKEMLAALESEDTGKPLTVLPPTCIALPSFSPLTFLVVAVFAVGQKHGHCTRDR